MLKAVMYQTIFAWCLATIVYQIGNISNFLIISGITIIVIETLRNKKKTSNKECNRCPYCNSCSSMLK